MTEEETTEIKQAPGMILAYAPQEAEETCLLYTSPSPRDRSLSRMPSSA